MTTFAPLFVPAELRDAVSDRAWLEAMLAAERALSSASARAGVVPADVAAEIAAACDPLLYDVDELSSEGRGAGNPVEPLVRALRARVGENARWAHRGATSQDILDSAAMLVAREALRLIRSDLDAVGDSCAELAA